MLGGSSSTMLAGQDLPQVGIDLTVLLAFGLTHVTMAFAISHVSGWPGVRRCRSVFSQLAAEVVACIVAQVVGGVVRQRAL